jgi:hypothetical protein
VVGENSPVVMLRPSVKPEHAPLRYLGKRATRHVRHPAKPGPDPSSGYPAAQRRTVRVYSLVLLAGTATCLAVELAVSLPALTAGGAATSIRSGRQPGPPAPEGGDST